MTKSRLDVLGILHEVGGRVHSPDGAAMKQLASALGYSGSLTGLKRVLAALADHGYVRCDPASGRVRTVTLTEAGKSLLADRGRSRDSCRLQLDEDLASSRERLVFSTQVLAQRLIDWAETVDPADPPADIVLAAELALHSDAEALLPDADELAVVVARTRIGLAGLIDVYLVDPSGVDQALVDAALGAILEARKALVSMRLALSG